MQAYEYDMAATDEIDECVYEATGRLVCRFAR